MECRRTNAYAAYDDFLDYAGKPARRDLAERAVYRTAISMRPCGLPSCGENNRLPANHESLSPHAAKARSGPGARVLGVAD